MDAVSLMTTQIKIQQKGSLWAPKNIRVPIVGLAHKTKFSEKVKSSSRIWRKNMEMNLTQFFIGFQVRGLIICMARVVIMHYVAVACQLFSSSS